MFSPDTLDTLEDWQLAFVEDAVANGCQWYQTGWHSWALNTGPLGHPDAQGSFNIRLYGQPGDFGMFYISPGEDIDNSARSVNCGNVPNNIFDVEAMVAQAGTCPSCGSYVGIDKLYDVSWAGRACGNCAPEAQAEFEDYQRRYGGRD